MDELILAGVSYVEIARRCGTSFATAQRRGRALGIVRNGRTGKLPKRLVTELYLNQKWSISRIAARLGETPGVIKNFLRRSIPGQLRGRGKQPAMAEEQIRWATHMRSKVNCIEIARILGVPVRSVRDATRKVLGSAGYVRRNAKDPVVQCSGDGLEPAGGVAEQGDLAAGLVAGEAVRESCPPDQHAGRDPADVRGVDAADVHSDQA